MSRTITSDILAAYSQCPRKAFLLMCTNEQGVPHEYVRTIEQKRCASRNKYIQVLKQKHTDVQPYNLDHLNNGNDYLINATLKACGLEADCGILMKVKEHSALGKHSYEPTIFVGTHSISKTHKLELFFVSSVLEQIQKTPPVAGRIVGADGKSHRVKLENGHKSLIPLLEPLQEWATDSSPKPPPVILNKHCSSCQFQNLCFAQAEQEDNLSLLDRVTPKVIRKYEKKGIFTVKQLSYTFKPRKRKKRTKNPPPVTYKPELQALAIRTGKIYLQELPDLSKQSVELFLDIEGVPDQQLYYLIGVLVCEGETCAYHSFWADTPEDEAVIWKQFLEAVNQYPDAPIYHYGSYERRGIKQLARRYETDGERFINRLVNVNSYIYGKVYFPVRSNGLKEIGNFIGATWTAPNASGLQSLVWRHYWEETRNTKYRNLLVTYNKEDCQALKLLTDELSKIKHSADTLSEVDFANKSTVPVTEVGQQIHSQFETMIKFSSASYDSHKISFRQDDKEGEGSRKSKKRGPSKGYHKQRRQKLRGARRIQVPDGKTCPKCGQAPLRPTKQTSKRLIIDFVMQRSGLRKTITEYVGVQGYCSKCHKSHVPPGISKYHRSQLLGPGFKALLVYYRVALRLPYESIVEMMAEQYHEKIDVGSIPHSMKNLARYYAETEKVNRQRLLESPFIHADETTISIRGANWYVWVFTNEKYVIFKLRETREATIAHEFLADYEGILISDFYPGYDSINCGQQKCWVHLIRDINNDLRENPFDTEFETFVLEIRNLIIPIMETVQQYGLKKRNLNKFRKRVDKFYTKVIIDKRYKSEETLKYQNRFIRYRDSLFTFLEQDGIPWHNNAAERAIRHVAIQRARSTSLSKSVTQDYLLLLGIKQTCRFFGKSFFKFLFSEETDLDKFKGRKR